MSVKVEIELTERELKLLRLLVDGKSYKQLMQDVGVSRTRIMQLVQALYLKCGIESHDHTRVLLARWAIRNKIIEA